MKSETYSRINDLTYAIDRLIEVKIVMKLAPSEEAKAEVEYAYEDLRHTVGRIADSLEVEFDDASRGQKS